MDQPVVRSHPNKAVDVVACQTFSIILAFFEPSTLACSLVMRARQPPASASLTSPAAAVHKLLHLPRDGAVRLPASGPLLPLLSSSHSFRRARITLAHSVVSLYPVRTAPRCTARSLPVAGAASYPRL